MVIKPLEGIHILDFGWVLVGPLTTKLLASYGAEVIKLEGKTRADVCRTQGPFQKGNVGLDRSYRFLWTNTSKKSVTLNLAHPKGKKIAKRFVEWADVVVENFAGGAMERMGFGYDELKKIKPDIIMLSTSMQGQTGPHAGHPGYGMQLTALAGFDSITGWPDMEPVELGFYTDFIAPHLNVTAILAAIDHRARTGEGQYLDVSQYEAGAHFLSPLLLDYEINGRIAGRMGNACSNAVPNNVYRCRGEDRWCAISVTGEKEWECLKKVVARPWIEDTRFATLQKRQENEALLDSLIESWTVDQTAGEVMMKLQSMGVGAGVVQDAEDLLLKDPQLQYRHFFTRLEHPGVGSYSAMRPYFSLSQAEPEITRAPLIGEHNDYGYKDILKLTDEEIADLVIEGVIE